MFEKWFCAAILVLRFSGGNFQRNFKILVSRIKLVMAVEAVAGAGIWDLNEWKKTLDLTPTRLKSNATGILLFLRS